MCLQGTTNVDLSMDFWTPRLSVSFIKYIQTRSVIVRRFWTTFWQLAKMACHSEFVTLFLENSISFRNLRPRKTPYTSFKGESVVISHKASAILFSGNSIPNSQSIQFLYRNIIQHRKIIEKKLENRPVPVFTKTSNFQNYSELSRFSGHTVWLHFDLS